MNKTQSKTTSNTDHAQLSLIVYMWSKPKKLSYD